MAKAKAKTNKQCPICKMEVDSEAVICPGCAAVFDDSSLGATAPTPEPDELPDDEAPPNGEDVETDAEKADADTEENPAP